MSTYLPTYLPTCNMTDHGVYLPMTWLITVSTYLPTYDMTDHGVYLPTYDMTDIPQCMPYDRSNEIRRFVFLHQKLLLESWKSKLAPRAKAPTQVHRRGSGRYGSICCTVGKPVASDIGNAVQSFLNPRPLFHYLHLFQTKITIFTTNKCGKCPSSIWCWDSNPQPL